MNGYQSHAEIDELLKCAVEFAREPLPKSELKEYEETHYQSGYRQGRCRVVSPPGQGSEQEDGAHCRGPDH